MHVLLAFESTDVPLPRDDIRGIKREENRQSSRNLGNSYIEINRAKVVQLEREKSKAGRRAGGPSDTTRLTEEDKAETVRGAGRPRGS